ncbi:MAG: ABC transporter substrate-binding protein [Culicoidibacterales bacterium]
MKRQLFLLASIVVMLLILGLIGGMFNYTTLNEQEIVLRFANWSYSPAENIIIDRVIDSFTKKTGIYVERESYTYNYSSIMTNKLQKNEAPDVFYVSQMDYNYWQQCGWLANVSTLINPKSQYYQPIQETFMTDGELYAIPKDFSAMMMYINEDLLHQAGYQMSDIPEDINDFPAFLAQLQKQLPTGITAMTLDVQFENFMAVFERLDPVAYATFDFANSQPIQRFITALSQLVQSGVVNLINENLDQTRAGEQFHDQLAVITIEGNWLFNELSYYAAPFAYQVAQLPQVNGEVPMAAYFTGYGMSTTTKYEAEAQAFIEYLTTNLAPYIVENMSSFPVNENVAREVFKLGNSNLNQIGQEMVAHLGSEVTSGQDYTHTIYSYYFGVKLPELMQQPTETSRVFTEMLEGTRLVEGYVTDFVKLRQVE